PNRAEKLLELAEWAVSHGLLDKVSKVIEELAQIDAKHPSVVAYQKIEAAMNKPVSRDDAAVSWRERLGEYKIKNSKHYTLLYDVSEEAQADLRLKHLEQNYRGFFTWFALRGRALPVPESRLVAVLVESPEAFEHQYKDIFDAPPKEDDGFFDRRENLAV